MTQKIEVSAECNNGRISVDVDKLMRSPKFQQTLKDCVTLREIPPDEGRHLAGCPYMKGNGPCDCHEPTPAAPIKSSGSKIPNNSFDTPAAPKDGADELLLECRSLTFEGPLVRRDSPELRNRIDAYRASSPRTEGWRERMWCVHSTITKERCGTPDDVRFVALALAGEVGELCNLIKKDWRQAWGTKVDDEERLWREVADEIADVHCYLWLLTRLLNLDLEQITAAKSKVVEQRYGPEVQAALALLAGKERKDE
jgi:NTP pyrophosphatase (non-canonical NTP hydrolase)